MFCSMPDRAERSIQSARRILSRIAVDAVADQHAIFDVQTRTKIEYPVVCRIGLALLRRCDLIAGRRRGSLVVNLDYTAPIRCSVPRRTLAMLAPRPGRLGSSPVG